MMEKELVKKLLSHGDCYVKKYGYYQQDESLIAARLELDGGKSIIFGLTGDLDDFNIEWSEEFLDNKKHGRSIYWQEWINYEEYKGGILDGYREYAFQDYLGERGYYKNGEKDKWWEYGDDSLEHEYDQDHYHPLSKYRAPYVEFSSKGLDLERFWITDLDYEYELFAESDEGFNPSYARKKIEDGEIYRGYRGSYLSYATYQQLTNLPKLKPPEGDSSQSNELYSHCARVIDYDQILNGYMQLLSERLPKAKLLA